MSAFTIDFEGQRLQVEKTKDGEILVYRVIWPDDSRKFLYLDHGFNPPTRRYLPGESQKEAKMIGRLIEQMLN